MLIHGRKRFYVYLALLAFEERILTAALRLRSTTREGCVHLQKERAAGRKELVEELSKIMEACRE